MTAAELAEELEVSVRTIYRDVEALAEAGVPIYAERGPHGGVRLVDGYRTRLTGLTADEAEAVFLSGLPGPAAELGLGTVVAAARLKVMAALPPELRVRAGRIAERFHLDAPGWFQTYEELPHLEMLASAVWQSHEVRMLYRRGDRGGIVERQIEPLGLVLKGGIWYLVARAATNIRTYRVSRVLEMTVLPRALRAAGRLRSRRSLGPLDHRIRGCGRPCRGHGQVALRPTGRLRRRSRIEAHGERDARTRSGHTGRRPAHLTFDWIDRAVGVALRLGADVEVLEPAWLRRSIFDSATAIVERYAERSVAAAPV